MKAILMIDGAEMQHEVMRPAPSIVQVWWSCAIDESTFTVGRFAFAQMVKTVAAYDFVEFVTQPYDVRSEWYRRKERGNG